MRSNSTRPLWMTLALVGCLTIPVYGEAWDFAWDTDCGGAMDCLFETCWCEADWSDSNNWSGAGSPPPGSTETAQVTWSNEDTTCATNLADENWLQINVDGDAVETLELRAECCQTSCCPSTCTGAGNLRVAFWGGTLTAHGAFQIDGENGPVLVEVGGGAQITTN